MFRAKPDSSYLLSEKPMLYVLTSPSDSSFISAVTIVESIPPLRNDPMGLSEINLVLTA